MRRSNPPKSSTSLRPPRQERSRERLERIIKTTEALLKERRFDQITITDIVKGADTSVGVFYSRFANKEALLEFLEEKVYEEVSAIAAAKLGVDAASSPEELVHQVVDLAVRVHKRYSGVSREIVHAAWGNPKHLKRGVQWNEQLGDLLRPILSGVANTKVHADPSKAADFAILMMLGSIREMIPGNFWPRKMRPTQKEIVDQLALAVLRYLRG